GQHLLYDALQNDFANISAQLLSPTGLTLFASNSDNDRGPIALTETGTYQLVLSGGGATTGTYQFRLLDASTQPALATGIPVSGTLSPGLSEAAYQITGTAGQRLTFHSVSLSPANAGNWTLYGTADQVVGSNSLGTDFTVTLPATGTYRLVLDGNV